MIKAAPIWQSLSYISNIINHIWPGATWFPTPYNLSNVINHIWPGATWFPTPYNLSDAINHIWPGANRFPTPYNLSDAINHIWLAFTIQLLVYNLINPAIWLAIEHVETKVVSERIKCRMRLTSLQTLSTAIRQSYIL